MHSQCWKSRKEETEKKNITISTKNVTRTTFFMSERRETVI